MPCFADTILSVSLLSPCVMAFEHAASGEAVSLMLEPRSLLVLQGEARYQWKHSIPARKTDHHEGGQVVRGRRISLTFRNVVLNKEQR